MSSSYLGRWVDRASTRLRPLLLTIFANRISLVVCCVLWLLLFSASQGAVRKALFAIILLLGMIEKASRMTNILSMERDWVPVLANEDETGYGLTHMNTAMRRIDIACKFVAPLAISSIVAVFEPMWSAVVIALVSSISVVVESWIVLKVWKHNSRLRTGKGRKHNHRFTEMLPGTQRGNTDSVLVVISKSKAIMRNMSDLIQANIDGVRYYFSTSVCLPSICVAVLHGSVLAWSGTLITWLLNEHFSLAEITIAKGVGSIFEIASTLVFPWAVKLLLSGSGSQESAVSYQMVGQRNSHEETSESTIHSLDPTDKHYENVATTDLLIGSRDLHVAVVGVARWSLSALSLTLVPTVTALFVLNQYIEESSPSAPGGDEVSPLYTNTTTAIAAIAFWSFISLSFVGRWTYDLAATQLTQMLVPSTHRAAFGGTEQAAVSMVSLVHWIAAAIWHQQSDFVWLALASAIGVGAATLAFLAWARTF